MVITRATRTLLLGAFVFLSATAAQAAPSASIVMDMRNGKVLHASSADRRLHPASLTKMMTLYLTFDAVRRGKIKLDQKVRVSRHASRMPASKLYLKAGQRVTIRSLIRATAIKSANDAAMVLAETIGGSQAGFARMMTNEAKRLGMKNTRFKNPHGLTQRGHYSTARDMAILGRHLFHDFPQYYNIFSRKRDHAAGKRIWATNRRFLNSYRGADGIKTGYTRAAGYNLVASAHRGQERIIAVVFGARNTTDRTRKVSRLLDIGFAKAPTRVATVKPRAQSSAGRRGRIVVAEAPVPVLKPGNTRATVGSLLAEVLSSPASAATPDRVTLKRASDGGEAKRTSPKRISASRHAPKKAELPRPRTGVVTAAHPLVIPAGLGIVPLPPSKPLHLASR